MKKIKIITLLMVLPIITYDQDIRTLTSKDTIKTFGGYGAPIVETTQMTGEWGVLFGGKGGVILNRKFAFGGVGVAMVSNHVFNGNTETTSGPMQLEYASGGIFFEYFYKLESPVHFSIPINIMGGGVTVLDEHSNQEIEASGMLVLQPGLNVEFNVTKFFIPGFYVSYRQVIGSSLENFDNSDLSGLSLGLVLKFGGF